MPHNPDNYEDINAQSFWVGLQGSGGPGIVQSVLKWEESGGVWGWYIYAEYNLNNSGYIHNPPQAVAEGDIIEGTMYIAAGDTGDGDAWYINAYDEDSGVSANFTVYDGSSNLPFTSANLGVLETHALVACDGLSLSDSERFTLSTLTEEGTAWNDYVDVSGLVTPTNSYGGVPPSCGWDAAHYDTSGVRSALLSWVWTD